MGPDLFDHVKNKNKTLSDFLRPETLGDVVGQKHLLGKGKPFRMLLESDRLNSIIMFGPPGIGKTTISRVYANMTGSPFIQLNAALCGTAELKNAAAFHGDKKPIIFLDEVHRFNKAQQDVLLPFIEDGKIRFIGATTYNPMIYIVPALRSRSMIFELRHIVEDEVAEFVGTLFSGGRLLEYVRTQLGYAGASKVEADEKAVEYISRSCNGDIRVMMNVLETALIMCCAEEGRKPDGVVMVTADDLRQVVPEKIAFYDRDGDEHYNTISAFIKSVRGSDAQAAVYYLARMLASGEDPRFVARRIVILASEDIGMADPRGLQIAMDAMFAVEHIGMPEARIILSHATIYLATAPKSNSALKAINEATEFCERHPDLPIPACLKNVKLDDKSAPGYKYPHDYPNHFVRQRYMETDAVFYRPTTIGYEGKIAKYLTEVTKV